VTLPVLIGSRPVRSLFEAHDDAKPPATSCAGRPYVDTGGSLGVLRSGGWAPPRCWPGVDAVIAFTTTLVALELESHQAKVNAAIVGIVLGTLVTAGALIAERRRRSREQPSPPLPLPSSSVLKLRHGYEVTAERVETDADVPFDLGRVGKTALKDIRQNRGIPLGVSLTAGSPSSARCRAAFISLCCANGPRWHHSDLEQQRSTERHDWHDASNPHPTPMAGVMPQRDE
jgi:hypothetical protein